MCATLTSDILRYSTCYYSVSYLPPTHLVTDGKSDTRLYSEPHCIAALWSVPVTRIRRRCWPGWLATPRWFAHPKMATHHNTNHSPNHPLGPVGHVTSNFGEPEDQCRVAPSIVNLSSPKISSEMHGHLRTT